MKTFDAYCKETFDMHEVLLWTLQDFPGYADVLSWSTKGFLPCPNCHKDIRSKRLRHGKKWCYIADCRFLEPDHKWRFNKTSLIRV